MKQPTFLIPGLLLLILAGICIIAGAIELFSGGADAMGVIAMGLAAAVGANLIFTEGRVEKLEDELKAHKEKAFHGLWKK